MSPKGCWVNNLVYKLGKFILSKQNISQEIKEYALTLGFDACGICKVQDIGKEKANVKEWLDKGYHAGMKYLENNFDKRCNPSLLVENAKSVICVALNYYPQVKRNPDYPHIAYYAYGEDYHQVIKGKLSRLYDFIRSIEPSVTGRYFCDTAPVLERYWAAQSGIGFIGKNTLLIIPRKGSFFFLGELVVDIELEYDKAINISCGNCTSCLDHCPTCALEKPYLLNSNKCISYHTIENKGEIDKNIIPLLHNCLYGCDICQSVCPWNRFSVCTSIPEFYPSEEFMQLSEDKFKKMTIDDYRRIFKGTAIIRVKYDKLMNNFQSLKE